MEYQSTGILENTQSLNEDCGQFVIVENPPSPCAFVEVETVEERMDESSPSPDSQSSSEGSLITPRKSLIVNVRVTEPESDPFEPQEVVEDKPEKLTKRQMLLQEQEAEIQQLQETADAKKKEMEELCNLYKQTQREIKDISLENATLDKTVCAKVNQMFEHFPKEFTITNDWISQWLNACNKGLEL